MPGFVGHRELTMRLRSVVRVLGAAVAFGLAAMPMSASAGCGCRATAYHHGHYDHAAYGAPAVFFHRNQYPMAYYNEAAPPYYPRAHRYHHPHPPLHRYY